MATASLSALRLYPLSRFSSAHDYNFPQIPRHVAFLPRYKVLKSKSLTRISFALTESSDSPKSLDPDPQILLQELADCFVLPGDYFQQLPRDLRLDLNDAAFDLSNGAVKDECGEEVGEILLNISRAWERADTPISASLMSKLPQLVSSLSSNIKSALGKRLIAASRRFQSMGQYGQGEPQAIAKVISRTGKLLSTTAVPEAANEEPKQETRVLKFGELQVELTPEKAYIGAVIGFIFAILSWQVSRGVESIPESSLEYANDNALLLAKCFSSGRSGGSRWDWEKSRKPNRRSRFSDAYVTDDYDEEVEFGSRNAVKKRMWWSDDYYPEDDWEEDEGFGILEASIGFNWVFKVFRAFGWMIPAVIISLLLGTGSDSIIMALALPLAQTALSLATEALLGRPDKKPRPKSKSKKRPFAGAPRRTRMRKEKDVRNQTGRGTTNYKSWVDATDVSSKQKRNPHFGGWDELESEEPRATPVEKGNEPRIQERIKISSRIKGDIALLMRFLIAMFPYLGFWIKLF